MATFPVGYYPPGFFSPGYFSGGVEEDPIIPDPNGSGSHFPAGFFPEGMFPVGFFPGGVQSVVGFSLAEFLTNLYNDELSDLYIGNQNYPEEARPKLLPIINTAMLQAYAKYRVIVAIEAVELTRGVVVYSLQAENVLAVLDVTNSYGRSLATDEVRILGTSLTFPCPRETTVHVEYKLKPTKFVEDQNDEEVGLILPTLLVPWLSSWVAHRVYRARKDEGSLAKAAELLTAANEYEMIYQQTNTTNEFTSCGNNSFCAKGFV
jgi:hypothetical protein